MSGPKKWTLHFLPITQMGHGYFLIKPGFVRDTSFVTTGLHLSGTPGKKESYSNIAAGVTGVTGVALSYTNARYLAENIMYGTMIIMKTIQ